MSCINAAIFEQMEQDTPESITPPNNAWGFLGWVLARFGPWGAILVILGIVMGFVLTVYNDGKSTKDQLVGIVQQQSITAIAQASATESISRSVLDLKNSTEGLRNSIEQMNRDFRDQTRVMVR